MINIIIKKGINALSTNLFIIRLKVNNVKYGRHIRCYGNVIMKIQGKMSIGNNFKINSGKKYNSIGGDTESKIIIKNNATLIIGEKVGISNSSIVCWESIEIQNNVLIGGGCKIWDTDFHSLDPNIRKNGDNEVKKSKIIIKNNAFIGGSSIILKGVVIGENAIIAAGSVVTKSVPDNEIWGGNPAKFIRAI